MDYQDPLEEINLETEKNRKPTYVSKMLDARLRENIVSLLQEFKDCFAWDYEDMCGLSRELVEHRFPIYEGRNPVKHAPRRFAPNVMEDIKVEIERLLKANFIQTIRYVDWISNIVLVIKKNRKLLVCIDFRDLNVATPKDEYSMPIVDMLIDSIVGKRIKSMRWLFRI